MLLLCLVGTTGCKKVHQSKVREALKLFWLQVTPYFWLIIDDSEAGLFKQSKVICCYILCTI